MMIRITTIIVMIISPVAQVEKYKQQHTKTCINATPCAAISSPRAEERALSYLPLSHVAGFMVDIVTPVVVTARSPAWSVIFFARANDLKERRGADELLRLVRLMPTRTPHDKHHGAHDMHSLRSLGGLVQGTAKMHEIPSGGGCKMGGGLASAVSPLGTAPAKVFVNLTPTR